MGNIMAQGAGVLPYAKIIDANGTTKVVFLFHKTLQGKKVGTLIDFGGHKQENEPATLAAAREFSEETCGVFYLITKHSSSQLSNIIDEIMKNVKNEHEQQQLEIVKEATVWMNDKLESGHGTWSSQCVAFWGKYDLFLTAVEYVDPSILDKAFENKNGSDSSVKKRKFVWIDATSILEGKTELPLYDRVKDSKDFLKIVSEIYQQK